jgi:hypothetical protein
VPFKWNSHSDPTLPLEGPNPLIFLACSLKNILRVNYNLFGLFIFFFQPSNCFHNIYVMIFSLVHVAKKFLFAEHMAFILTIVLKPVNPGPGRSGAETGSGWRKNRGRKNPMWPGQKPGCNPLIFFFLLKKIFFNLKKMTRTIWWSGQKPEPGLKTIVLTPN